MCVLSQFSTDCSLDMKPEENGSTEIAEKWHTALALALPEVVKCTRAAVQKFLLMVNLLGAIILCLHVYIACLMWHFLKLIDH